MEAGLLLLLKKASTSSPSFSESTVSSSPYRSSDLQLPMSWRTWMALTGFLCIGFDLDAYVVELRSYVPLENLAAKLRSPRYTQDTKWFIMVWTSDPTSNRESFRVRVFERVYKGGTHRVSGFLTCLCISKV
jgi:hypothetical protein